MENLKIGNCYPRKNELGQVVAVAVISGFNIKGKVTWVECKMWTTAGLMGTTKYPSHFFEDEDDFFIVDRDTAMSSLVPIQLPVLKIERTTPNWLTIIGESLNNGQQNYLTSSINIKELIESAASRMNLEVNVCLVSDGQT
jgi:hypothetical protein